MSPDSRPETLAHIARVRELLEPIVEELHRRGRDHDASKLVEPEVTMYDRYTPMLASSEYGSPEYHATLREMGPALQHHYANNRHHPECHAAGIEGMTLVDLLEMLADWKASTERRPGGSLARSLHVQEMRFGISESLMHVLRNTAIALGWMSEEDDVHAPGGGT